MIALKLKWMWVLSEERKESEFKKLPKVYEDLFLKQEAEDFIPRNLASNPLNVLIGSFIKIYR